MTLAERVAEADYEMKVAEVIFQRKQQDYKVLFKEFAESKQNNTPQEAVVEEE